MSRFECEIRGVFFSVEYEGPANVTPGYRVVARRGREEARGRVSYALLTRKRAVVNSFEFYNAPDWLVQIFGKHQWRDEDGTPFGTYSTFVPAPPGFADWLRRDYTRRFQAVLEQLRAGIEPEHYRELWYYELCREAGIDCWDDLTPGELVAAVDAAVSRCCGG